MSYKRPESVLIIVYSKDAQVLMLERVQPQGFWQSVTGSLQEGEFAIDAAHRELKEETGLQGHIISTNLENTFPILPAWRDRFAPEVSHNHETVFACEVDAPCEIALNPLEHMASRWLPREAAAEKASSWTNRDAILALVPEV